MDRRDFLKLGAALGAAGVLPVTQAQAVEAALKSGFPLSPEFVLTATGLEVVSKTFSLKAGELVKTGVELVSSKCNIKAAFLNLVGLGYGDKVDVEMRFPDWPCAAAAVQVKIFGPLGEVGVGEMTELHVEFHNGMKA